MKKPTIIYCLRTAHLFKNSAQTTLHLYSFCCVLSVAECTTTRQKDKKFPQQKSKKKNFPQKRNCKMKKGLHYQEKFLELVSVYGQTYPKELTFS